MSETSEAPTNPQGQASSARRPEAKPEKIGRYNYIGAPEAFSLEMACDLVGRSFCEMCYLVGSATQRMDFRDVDVRIILDDEKWEALFGSSHGGHTLPFWSLMCVSISEFLTKRTGLKVDFQIQRRGSVSRADWDKPRVPLGIYPINTLAKWQDL